jgi:hypothetical protein
MRSESDYKRILLNRDFKVNVAKYYKAAIILVGNIPPLSKLEERFKNLEQIQTICQKQISLFNTDVTEWMYGGVREKFAQVALHKGYKFNQVNSLIDIIDAEIRKRE